jgi:hypothetical protein
MSKADNTLEGLAARVAALEAAQVPADLVERLEKVEGLATETASAVEALDMAGAARPSGPAPLNPKDPLHPSRAGTADYNKLRAKLLGVKPNEKEYAAAQAQLRAAGLI